MKIKDKKEKLRIAFVFDRYHPDGRGEGYFSWLIGALSKRGHDVHVFAAVADTGPVTGYQLHRIRTLRHPQSLMLISFLINSARVLRQGKFEIIHGVGRCVSINVFNPHGGVEKAYLRQEFSSMENRLYFLFKFLLRYLSPQHYLKLWIQNRQYANGHVGKFIAISEMVKRDMIRYYGISEGRVSVIPNCVDLERFHPKNRSIYRVSKRRELGIDEETIVLLFAGNNYRLKGLEPLLKAVGLLRERLSNQKVHLLVAGRGQIKRYSKLAARLGIASWTSFLGLVDRMEQYYAAGDIYVQPTFYDPCSLTVLEALASGLPAITTRFNGAADVITSEDGGQVIDDPTNIENLAESIAFFSSEKRRNEAGTVARQWMENNPPTQHVEEILKVYYEVAGQTGMPEES